MNIEDIRKRYLPKKVRILFVGESPPVSGNFFYQKGSMTAYTAKAFENVFGIKFKDQQDFLRYFKNLGCYLEDLSHEPVNQLKGSERERVLIKNIDTLANRIKSLKPEFVVAVFKKIGKHVRRAVKLTGYQPKVYVLYAPGQSHQNKYIEGLSDLLKKYFIVENSTSSLPFQTKRAYKTDKENWNMEDEFASKFSNGRGILISPNYCQEDWNELILNERDSKDWNTAINIFKDRMEGRFLKQIDVLDNNPNRNIGIFAGFAIMSLDCLFIETLEQFYNGKIRTGQGMDEKAFFNFFQRSQKFKSFFNTQSKATIFYKHIRCGLLHQAQTKKKSTIHIRNEEMLQWVVPKKIDEGLKIQRKLFHDEILNIYNFYVDELKEKGNLNLRRKLKRKMDFIVNQQ